MFSLPLLEIRNHYVIVHTTTKIRRIHINYVCICKVSQIWEHVLLVSITIPDHFFIIIKQTEIVVKPIWPLLLQFRKHQIKGDEKQATILDTLAEDK